MSHRSRGSCTSANAFLMICSLIQSLSGNKLSDYLISRSYYSKYYQESRTFTESDQLLAKKNRRVSYGVSTSISVSDEDPSLDESSTSSKPPLTCRQWQACISILDIKLLDIFRLKLHFSLLHLKVIYTKYSKQIK